LTGVGHDAAARLVQAAHQAILTLFAHLPQHRQRELAADSSRHSGEIARWRGELPEARL
jgi:hypothetical protein